MAQFDYIGSGQFTNLVVQDFRSSNGLSGYLQQANDEIECLAISVGVSDFADIEQAPLHPLIKKYAVEYGYAQLFLDKMGANNIDQSLNDKYLILYEAHNKIAQELRKNITVEMMTGDADTPSETVGTCLIYRV